MKGLLILGVLLLVLGALSFFVPLPHQDNHRLTIGNANLTLETETREKLPPAVGLVLIGGGVLALILGLRNR